MSNFLIKNATIVNENKTFVGDVFIENEIISRIDSQIETQKNVTIIDAEGMYLVPGFIDDQVHFREPGLTHKANIASESRAAAAGGITTFIEQPNTIPNATTQALLEEKFQIAAKSSYVNFSFMFGGTNTNLEEVLKTDKKNQIIMNGYKSSFKDKNFINCPASKEKGRKTSCEDCGLCKGVSHSSKRNVVIVEH